MLLPGVKIVEGGVLRAKTSGKMIMGMTRLPHVLGLDLQGDDRRQQRGDPPRHMS